MKFNYKNDRGTLRPIIPIVLCNKDSKLGYHVLVDSGADMCLFDIKIATELGLDVKSGKIKEVVGVGGKSSIFYLHKITIEVGGWPFEIEAGFMENVGLRTMPYGLVGQKGFFEKFIVKFDLLKEEIELKNREAKK